MPVHPFNATRLRLTRGNASQNDVTPRRAHRTRSARSLLVFAAAAMMSVGCSGGTPIAITGQLTLTDGSPMVDQSVMFWPGCKIPRMYQEGGWMGTSDFAYFESFRDGSPVSPESRTDGEGRFSLTVDRGWLRTVCMEEPTCQLRQSDMEAANVGCEAVGYTLALTNEGSENRRRIETLDAVSEVYGDDAWPRPINDSVPDVDLGTFELGSGWLLAAMDLPAEARKDAVVGTGQMFVGICGGCHGREGYGGPDSSIGQEGIRLTAGPDLTDEVWLHSDGSYEGILGSLKDNVCSFSLEDAFSELTGIWWGRDERDMRLEALQKNFALNVYALRYRPRVVE